MITGSLVALITPMKPKSFDVDWDCFEKLIKWHIFNKTNAIVVVGTTGESSTLSFSEHKRVIERALEYAEGEIPIIAGTGANSTSEAIELTRSAADAGADACLLVTPYYNKPSQNGLFEHYKLIANTVDVDQILYNVPSRTACDLLPETIHKLSQLDNIVGVKEATGDMDRLLYLKKSCHPEFALYSGDDLTACEFMLSGGHGDISVTANIAPLLMSEFCRAAIEGKTELARKLNSKLEMLHQVLFLESNPVPVKWAASYLGLVDNVLRLPLVPLNAEKRVVVEKELNKLCLKGFAS
jgi:4-hydroxy-tetrahydrodipicolinate synthase